MRKKILPGLVLAVTLICFVPLSANAGCDFQGSWMGYNADGAYWVSTADGLSSSSGTYRLEAPGFLNLLQGADRVSVLRGTWERINGSTFAFTVVGIAVDSTGNTLYVVKVSGIDTLSKDCNSMAIANTIELFSGTQSPFADAPFQVIVGNPHSGSRMSVDPPATP